MAKAKRNLRKELSSTTRRSLRTSDGPAISLKPVHLAIKAARQELLDNLPEEGNELLKERFITAIRNLDIARVALECNESLSPTDYNIEPWDHLEGMDRLLAAKKMGAVKR